MRVALHRGVRPRLGGSDRFRELGIQAKTMLARFNVLRKSHEALMRPLTSTLRDLPFRRAERAPVLSTKTRTERPASLAAQSFEATVKATTSRGKICVCRGSRAATKSCGVWQEELDVVAVGENAAKTSRSFCVSVEDEGVNRAKSNDCRREHHELVEPPLKIVKKR